jgi:hypothetical protein
MEQINVLSTMKLELYNEITNYKYMITNAKYYNQLRPLQEYNNILQKYNSYSKIQMYNYQILLNEDMIYDINIQLDTLCHHTWETDFIETGIESSPNMITTCCICMMNLSDSKDNN